MKTGTMSNAMFSTQFALVTWRADPQSGQPVERDQDLLFFSPFPILGLYEDKQRRTARNRQTIWHEGRIYTHL